MNPPPHNTPQFVSPIPPANWQTPPELMMSGQQFRTPFHNDNHHRPALMRSSPIPPANWQTPPELMMSGQQFRTPFHNDNHHRPALMRSSVSTNRYSPYKVELCTNFQRGNCNYGDKCRFAHSVGDLKARLCWRYSNRGQCPFGERCHYIHDNSRKSVAISVVNVNRGGGDDGDGLNAGRQVYQRPVGMKTRLCKKWEANGSCPYGNNCIFAHGESELVESENGKASPYVTMPKKQVLGHQWEFKWTDIEKISRIYGDWIETTPLVQDKSDTMGN